jgi:hypothetical protein
MSDPAEVRRPGDGRLHVHPPPLVRLGLLIGTLFLAALVYGTSLRDWYGDLVRAYEKTPILRGILEETTGRAFAPVEPVDVPLLPWAFQRDSGGRQGDQSAPDAGGVVFADHRPPTRNELFELLKVVGVIDADRELAEFNPGTDGTPTPEGHLLDDLVAVTRGRRINEITPAWLASRLAERRGHGASGGAGPQPADCWEKALVQVLAGLPGRPQTFLQEARERVRAKTGLSDCPAAFTAAPGIVSYMLHFRDTLVSDTSTVRALLLLASVVPADDNIASPEKTVGDAPRLLELFLRRLLNRARSMPSVEGARFWIEMLQGAVQWLLIWATLFLAALALARMAMRLMLKREIRELVHWLDLRRDELANADPEKRQSVARDLVQALEARLNDSGPRRPRPAVRDIIHKAGGLAQDARDLFQSPSTNIC